MNAPVVCPVCQRLLKKLNDNSPRSGGTIVCPGCKNKIHYEHDGLRVYVFRA